MKNAAFLLAIMSSVWQYRNDLALFSVPQDDNVIRRTEKNSKRKELLNDPCSMKKRQKA